VGAGGRVRFDELKEKLKWTNAGGTGSRREDDRGKGI